jgi:hypothetical protein
MMLYRTSFIQVLIDVDVSGVTIRTVFRHMPAVVFRSPHQTSLFTTFLARPYALSPTA